jgi:hypothetical protein
VGDGGKAGALFQLAAETWARNNNDCKCEHHEIVSASTGDEALDAMEAYAEKWGTIDGLRIFAHSGSNAIFFDTGSWYQSLYSGGVGHVTSYVDFVTGAARIESIDRSWFDPDATFQLFGCRTAQGDSSLAQALANHLRISGMGSQSPTHFEPNDVRADDHKTDVNMVPDRPKEGWITINPE